MTTEVDTQALLDQHFGFRKFLDAQEEVVQTILAGEDVLVVMPTGGGKSLCYQLPALILEGVTVVVSPLIALMKDQVDALQRRGIAATLINSTLTPTEQSERIRRLSRGDYKLVYIAPERFRQHSFLQALGEATISLFAVDEAHCISQWGHDFRPDYFRLGEVLERLGRPQCAAFTATATPEVRQDILVQLGLREPKEFVAGFSRPNLRLNIVHVDKEAKKYDRIRSIIAEQKTGIVYCATRKRVEAVNQTLQSWGVRTIAYHGGMSDTERENAQNLFITRKADVAVATNAFGMGIDRSDIRFVSHFETPGSIEAYYQEAGRAGRDGEPSICELYFNFADTKIQEFFLDGSNPSRELILDVYDALKSSADETGEVRMPIRELAARLQEHNGGTAANNEMSVSAALSVLQRADYIDRFDIAGERVRGTRLLKPDLARHEVCLDWEALSEKERRDRSKLKAMINLVYARECRQSTILHYFGEKDPARCGNCDFCLTRTRTSLRVGTEEEVLIVRKALSGVARMKGRYGKGRVLQMLLGSRSKEVIDVGLDQLSTYGLLHHLSLSYLQELFREMQEAGLVTLEHRSGFDGRDYQFLQITPLGEQVMKNEVQCSLAWPDLGQLTATKLGAKSPKKNRGKAEMTQMPSSLPSVDPALLAQLKSKRLELARAQNVPAYVVFPDATLEFLAQLKPRSIEAGRRIRGIGEIKAEKYLPAFLEVIEEWS